MAVGERIKLFYCGYRQQVTNTNKKSYVFLKETGSEIRFSSSLKGMSPLIGQGIEVTETETGIKSPYIYLYDKPEGEPGRNSIFYPDKDLINYWRTCQRTDQILIDTFNIKSGEYEKRIDNIKREIKYLTSGLDARRKRAFILSLLDL